MNPRLNFIVEGRTEEAFVKKALIPHLSNYSVWGSVRCVTTCRKHGKPYRGGLVSFTQARNDINLWIKEDQNCEAFFTTMFDLYALPNDFPEFNQAKNNRDPYKRIEILEKAFYNSINCTRLIPYIQLYEFETLLLTNPQQMDCIFIERTSEIKNLVKMSSGFNSPELIDDGANTSPSKRIINEIPEYSGMKASAAPIIADKIGLPALKSRCPHFREWLTRLENLSKTDNKK